MFGAALTTASSFTPRTITPTTTAPIVAAYVQPTAPSVSPATVYPTSPAPAVLEQSAQRALPSTSLVLPPSGSSVPMIPMDAIRSAALSQISFEQKDGLWVVTPEAFPILRTLMQSMTYTKSDVPTSPALEIGKATFGFGNNAWTVAQQKLNEGFAVLIEKDSVPSGTFFLTFNKSPELVAKTASTTRALVFDEPHDLVFAARTSLGTQPDAGITIGGTKLPSWVVPVGVGVGALLLGALLFGGQKSATPNRRRRRR